MEIRHLRYFLVLSEELNFNKAAKKLFISQPPLSRQIKELEEELGVVLFNRNNKRVELTEAGRYFKKETQELLLSLERTTLKVKKIHNNQNGEFRIGYISSTFSGNISDLLTFLSEKYPFMTFRLYEVPSTKQIAALEQGKLDLGIIRAPLKSPRIKGTLWFKDSFSVIFSKQKLKIKTETDISNLKMEKFVFFNKDYAPEYNETLLQICASYGFIPEVIHESNSVQTIMQLVANGLGVSIIPTNVLRAVTLPNLESLELKTSNHYSEVLFATPKADKSLIAKEAIEFLRISRRS